MSTIKQDFLFILFSRIAQILVPIVVFSHVSRVLGPSSLGEVEFVISFSSFFFLFATLGIPLFGTRETSLISGNKKKLTKLFITLLIISSISSFFFTLIYVFTIFYFFSGNTSLLLYSLIIVFNPFNVDWFFQGLKKFKFISLVSIFLRLFSAFLILIILKLPDDNFKYLIILVSINISHNIISFIFSFKYLEFKYFEIDFQLIRKTFFFLLPFLALEILSTVASNIDKTMLGIMAGNLYLGLYASSNKIIKLLSVAIFSFFSILFPRLSSISDYNHKEEYNNKIKLINNLLLLIMFPISIFLAIFSKNIIYFLSGQEYLSSIKTLQILLPYVFFNSLSTLFGTNVLIQKNHQRKLMLILAFSFLVGIISNWILIPLLFQNGAALATTLTEAITFLLIIIVIIKYRIIQVDVFKNTYFLLTNSFFLLLVNFIDFTNYSFISIVFTLFSLLLYLFSFVIFKDLKESLQFIYKYLKSKN